MSRFMHGLTEIDIENKTALCSVCGPTGIYFRPDDNAVCLGYANESEKERYVRSQRKLVIHVLGGKCTLCGFDDWRALQIDHKRGTNRKRKSSHKIYAEILQNQSDEYQLLCANCNAIKASEHNERVGCYDPVRMR